VLSASAGAHFSLLEDSMMTRLAVLAIALMGVAGVAQAQSGPPRDPNGRPYVTSSPQPSPGDYTRERPGLQPPDQQAQTVSPGHGSVQHDTTFKDEYGFRYDARGDRIDARGRTISPHTTTP
jgi:hypothetical protein